MSLGACLPGLVADGKISAEQGAEAQALFDDLRSDFAARGAGETADALASHATIDALDRAAARKRFLAGRTIRVRTRIANDLRGYGDSGGAGGGGAGGGGGTGPIDPRSGPALFDHDPRAAYANLEGRRKAIVGDAHRTIDRILAEHSANLRGQVRKPAQLREIVRELFGQDSTNPAAREMADGWRRTAEMLRRRFNQAGGDIGKRDDWGLPQSHDWKRVRAAGYDAWRADILPRLDRAKMVDARTGRPFSDAGMEDALQATFDTIRTNGAINRSPGSPGGASLANSRAEERFFVFKSADDWMAYSEAYGSGSAFDVMMGHIEGMARDIAAMEILGPNPTATITWLKGTLEQSALLDRAPGSAAVQPARAAGKAIDDLWGEYSGANLEPRSEKLALVFSGYRAFATSTKLGSALLSATSDLAFQFSRRSFNGLSNRTLLPQYVKLMRPGSLASQRLAVRRGLIADQWSGQTASQSRYLGQELTGEIPRRLAEGTLRLSILARHTQALRWVYGMETLATYTEAAAHSMAALHPKLARALQRYGIGAGDWDRLRSARMDVDGGVEWISPHNLGDDDLASRFMAMVHEETDLAVPVADLTTRAMFSKIERGTWVGEIIRSAALFKSFGISVMVTQSREIMAMGAVDGGAFAARYAGGLMIGTTLMGAAAIQLKEVANGKDPRPMDGEAFWGAAMLQGGGWGIFGDFLNATQNRIGGGLAQSLSGPMVSDIQGIANVAFAQHPERSIVREAKGFLPGNNLWYTRLAFDRMMADQIEEAVNPDYRNSWKRMDRYAREYGTQYFWRPGDFLPERQPDGMNAFAEGPDE